MLALLKKGCEKLYLNTAENRERVIKVVLILLNLFIAGMIFFFSSQPAEVSGPMSEGVVHKILKTILITPEITEQEITEMSISLNKIARKLAHFSIYGALGLSMNLLVTRYKTTTKKAFFITVVICVLYAASDEIHQAFVPGRSCEIRDVFIDSLGILSGILIIYLIKKIKKN